MARFRYKHIQSTVEDKKPLDLLDGELAVNRFKGKEKIFLKNANNEIISFSSDSVIDGKLSDFFDDAKYEDSGTTKVINFYHGNTIKATIDASDFIKDGMIDDVRIENGYLVIDFNTASGKQDISIPLTDIFDPSNYYDKDDIDDLVGSGFTSSSITDVIIENEEIVSNALTDLDERKLDASAYTPIDFSNYYTKSETSGKTEISTALNGKVANNTFNTHSASTVHMTTTEKTNLDSLATNIAAISGITSTKVSNWDTAVTNNHTHSNKATLDAITATSAAINSLTGSVGTMAFENASSYSSATQVNTALSGKSNTSHTHDDRYFTESELTGSSTTVVVAKAASATTAAAASSVAWNNVSGKPDSYTPSAHNQASNTITAMTSYSIASASSAVSTSDSLNAAIGKLEKRIALLEAAIGGMKLVKLTQAQYDALTTKDNNTLYIISD